MTGLKNYISDSKQLINPMVFIFSKFFTNVIFFPEKGFSCLLFLLTSLVRNAVFRAMYWKSPAFTRFLA